jgi:hypothetical protein
VDDPLNRLQTGGLSGHLTVRISDEKPARHSLL